MPWRRRVKDVGDSGPSFDLPLGDDPISLVLGIVLLILVLPFLLVVVVAGLEFLLLLLVLPLAVVARVAFGAEWVVEVRRGWTPWWEIESGSWSDSRARIDDIAAAIGRGQLPPRTL